MDIGGSTDIECLRTAYNERSKVLADDVLPAKEPIAFFNKWFLEAKEHPDIIEPNAMCLATASKEAIPSARFVLCKNYNKEGFGFFTHYTSRKGRELEENPNAALTFYWAPLSRSVRVEGTVEKLPMIEAEKYFSGRPYPSQIGALCSDQSKPIENRSKLMKKEADLKSKYKEGEVPKPEFWGGYLLKPKTIEFWQGQTDRIHDRVKFYKKENIGEIEGGCFNEGEDGWYYQRLQP